MHPILGAAFALALLAGCAGTGAGTGLATAKAEAAAAVAATQAFAAAASSFPAGMQAITELVIANDAFQAATSTTPDAGVLADTLAGDLNAVVAAFGPQMPTHVATLLAAAAAAINAYKSSISASTG